VTVSSRRLPVALLLSSILLASCGQTPTASPSGAASASVSSSAAPSGLVAGEVVAAPGSNSEVYEPNPGSLVVAIDPGHGGCLDWGVPDPRQRGVDFAEKTMTLAIGRDLRDLLEAQGVHVVMTRTSDEALSGDDYPDLGCNGPAWRDVNGDGESGFHPEDVEGKVRTRDELQARLDLANVARADVLISIHINSLTQDGVVLEIAATETFYTDETPWGLSATEGLARLIQQEVVAAIGEVADYPREDRGIAAHNLYMVAPPLLEPTADRPDPRKQPTRGALMPSVLTEIGSITLAAEHDLLASPTGQATAAEGLYRALAAYFGRREQSVRYAVPSVEPPVGSAAQPIDGDGPPFWIADLPADVEEAGLAVVLTNTGTQPWEDGLGLLVGWSATDQPFLRVPPDTLEALPVQVPALAPGESVQLRLPIDPPIDPSSREVAWITLSGAGGTFADLGSPPLQLAWPVG
jgi:N-acetylmuramoyl-L-alanine amidase